MKAAQSSKGGRRAAASEEESIYNIDALSIKSSAPKVKTLHVTSSTPHSKPKMHADSSQVESLLNPVRGPRDAQARAGIKPTDHARNNRTAIKEASQLNAVRKLQQDQEPAPKSGISRQTSASTSKGAPRKELRRTSSSSDNGRDFVQENRIQAAEAKLVRAESQQEDTNKFLGKRDYGKVPQYLVERKAEMAAAYDAEVAAREAALIPPGMRILPEEEKQETLAMLEKNKAEVDKAIRALPFVIETPSQIRRQNDLQARMKEIEDAIKIFSRPKVLVHL